MAEPITIPIIQDPDLTPQDVVEVEINSAVQSDRFGVWPAVPDPGGFGFDAMDTGVFGFSSAGAVAFGQAVFGQGYFGYGAAVVEHDTRSSFVAGDYTVRLRSRDDLGNVSDWSDPGTIEHRPTPPPPDTLAIAAGVLTWSWSDP